MFGFDNRPLLKDANSGYSGVVMSWDPSGLSSSPQSIGRLRRQGSAAEIEHGTLEISFEIPRNIIRSRLQKPETRKLEDAPSLSHPARTSYPAPGRELHFLAGMSSQARWALAQHLAAIRRLRVPRPELLAGRPAHLRRGCLTTALATLQLAKPASQS